MDKIFKTLKYNQDFTVNDWNALIRLKLKPFFNNDTSFEKNIELLRSEIINYVLLRDDEAYLQLLKWTFDQFNEAFKSNKQICTDEFAKHFLEILNTDSIWLSYSINQPQFNSLNERDKPVYIFDTINNVLEKCFMPRFKLLYKFSYLNNSNSFGTELKDFGTLIRDFPKNKKTNAILYLSDPYFSISTNQWRNIAAHKTYEITKNEIKIKYGKTNVHNKTLMHDDLLKILDWVKKSYGALKLAEVLIYLNYTADIVHSSQFPKEYDIRFESWLLDIIHNMQIVGFPFVSTEKNDNIFIVNFKKKKDVTLQESIIHASQCLSQLSGALDSDNYLKDSYKFVQVNIVNDQDKLLASADVEIEKAILHSKGELSLEQYINNINFKLV